MYMYHLNFKCGTDKSLMVFIKASKKNPSAKDAIWSLVLSFCIKHFAEPFLHGSRPMQRCKLSDLCYINVAGALEMHILTVLGNPRVELVQCLNWFSNSFVAKSLQFCSVDYCDIF